MPKILLSKWAFEAISYCVGQILSIFHSDHQNLGSFNLISLNICPNISQILHLRGEPDKFVIVVVFSKAGSISPKSWIYFLSDKQKLLGKLFNLI